MLYIGIDLGTSSVKVVAASEDGTIFGSTTRTYPCLQPKPGWSEQDPHRWYKATCEAVRALLHTLGVSADSVAGISFGGQMHGLVALDERGEPIRDAILWNDGRSQAVCDELNERIGSEELTRRCGNIAFPGFTAPKVIWMRENEPEAYARIARVMLPKDYLAWRFTGVFCTDVSDASGTLLFDVAHRRWSAEMLAECGLTEAELPHVYESAGVVGTLTPEAAADLDLPASVKVIAGAGDNEAAAVGMACVREGQCNLSLGTSGTVFFPMAKMRVDSHGALHAFASAAGDWHLMGCTLSAASSLGWWMEDVLGTDDYELEQTRVGELGRNPVLFLPYLSGVRSPINDASVRGAFLGLRRGAGRAEMTQAVMEGVAFSLRQCVDVAASLSVRMDRVTICGGGAKSALWRRICANVLRRELSVLAREEGPGFGACVLAMVGCGAFASVAEAAEQLNHVVDTVPFDPEIAKRYEGRYELYLAAYPAVRELSHEIAKMEES